MTKESSDGLFRMIFGRVPSQQADKVDVIQHLLSHSEYVSGKLDAMIASGAPPEEIYAAGKLLRGESDASVDELKAEFVEAQTSGHTFLWMNDESEQGTQHRHIGTTLLMNLANAVVHLCMFVQRTGARCGADKAHFLRAYGVVRIIHLLRALRVMLNTDNAVEFWGLARTIYEIYCVGKAINALPSIADDLFDILRQQRTGHSAKWPSPVSLLRKANLTEEVAMFQGLYPELSAPVHFGLDHLDRYLGDRRSGLSTQVTDEEAGYTLLILNFLLLMVFEMILEWDVAKGMSKRDLLFQAKRTRGALRDYLDFLGSPGYWPEYFETRIRAND